MGRGIAMPNVYRAKLSSVLQALFGARSTDCEYAKILFKGPAKQTVTKRQGNLKLTPEEVALEKARVQFSLLMSGGRALEGVMKSLRKVIAVTWYDEDLGNKDELSLDMLLEAVDRQERIRTNRFIGTFEKVSDSIVALCAASAATRERDIKTLKFLWNSERLLLSRSSRVSFGTMNRISFAIERAAKATSAAFPSATFPLLNECVRRVRTAALAKMGPSWSRAIEQFDTATVNGVEKPIARRREVFDLYARLLGRPIEPRIREMFCGLKSTSRVSKSR